MEDLVPRPFAAHPIRDGRVVHDEDTYVATCPVSNCQYAVQLDDLQVAVDAVAGHAGRSHDYDSHRLDGTLPPIAMLTMALDEYHAGNTDDALAMVREARDRMHQWVIE